MLLYFFNISSHDSKMKRHITSGDRSDAGPARTSPQPSITPSSSPSRPSSSPSGKRTERSSESPKTKKGKPTSTSPPSSQRPSHDDNHFSSVSSMLFDPTSQSDIGLEEGVLSSTTPGFVFDGPASQSDIDLEDEFLSLTTPRFVFDGPASQSDIDLEDKFLSSTPSVFGAFTPRASNDSPNVLEICDDSPSPSPTKPVERSRSIRQ